MARGVWGNGRSQLERRRSNSENVAAADVAGVVAAKDVVWLLRQLSPGRRAARLAQSWSQLPASAVVADSSTGPQWPVAAGIVVDWG